MLPSNFRDGIYFSGRFDVRCISFTSLTFIGIARSFFKDGGYVTDLSTYPPSFRHTIHIRDKVIELRAWASEQPWWQYRSSYISANHPPCLSATSATSAMPIRIFYKRSGTYVTIGVLMDRAKAGRIRRKQ